MKVVDLLRQKEEHCLKADWTKFSRMLNLTSKTVGLPANTTVALAQKTTTSTLFPLYNHQQKKKITTHMLLFAAFNKASQLLPVGHTIYGEQHLAQAKVVEIQNLYARLCLCLPVGVKQRRRREVTQSGPTGFAANDEGVGGGGCSPA